MHVVFSWIASIAHLAVAAPVREVPLNPFAPDTLLIVLCYTSQTVAVLLMQTQLMRNPEPSKVVPEINPLTEPMVHRFVFFLHTTRRPSLLTPDSVTAKPNINNSEAWNLYVLLRNRTDLLIDFSSG